MWKAVRKSTLLGIFASIQLLASISQASGPAALAPNALLQWNSIGPAGTTYLGSVTASAGSVGVTVTSTSLERVAESYLWTGSFALNDFLLWNIDTGSPLTFTVDRAIQNVGAYIQGDIFGSFSVSITAFNMGTNLGSFTVTGDNSGAEDSSAPFLGVLSSSANITSVAFTETDANGTNALALDSLLLNTQVPEPNSLRLSTLTGAAMLLCCAFRSVANRC